MTSKQMHQSIEPADEGYVKSKRSAPTKRPNGRISAACGACKIRKTKCSGYPPPCKMCEQLNTSCVTDLTLDMRRRTALQKTIEESTAFQDVLKNVLRVLRRSDWDEVQDLVAHIRRIDQEDDLVDGLQARFHARRSRESRSSGRQIKQELVKAVRIGSEKEEAAPSSHFSPTLGLPQKRPLSAHEGDRVRPSINPSERGIAEVQVHNALESRYLSVISQLKTVSDWEAIPILHLFIKSLAGLEDVASLNLLNRRTSQPNENTTTGRLLRPTTGGGLIDPNRTDLHPSPQSTSLECSSPIVQHSSYGMWDDEGSVTATKVSISKGSSAHGNKYAFGSDIRRSSQTSLADSSVQTTAKEASEEASEGYQKHSAMCDAMQVSSTARVVELFGDLRALGGCGPRQFHNTSQDCDVQSSVTIPQYLIQSRLVSESSPLSKVFTLFRDAARKMIATGTPALDIIGGSDVMVDLFFRERCQTDSFTCSSWASELCRSFGEVDDTVRIGRAFLLTRLMRWMVCPTAETYDEIPDCQKPTPTQCFIPHMPTIDLHPMPAIRDMQCQNLRVWVTPMTQTGISCNWPFTMQEALETDAVTGFIRISESFGEHVSKSENWSLNSHSLSLFPELEGKVRVKDC